MQNLGSLTSSCVFGKEVPVTEEMVSVHHSLCTTLIAAQFLCQQAIERSIYGEDTLSHGPSESSAAEGGCCAGTLRRVLE